MKIACSCTAVVVNGLMMATALLLLLSSSLVQGGESVVQKKGHPHLKDPYSSSCNNVHQDNAGCLQSKDDVTGEFCVWCVAGAVPSECVNPEQAKMLPQGVFDCETPGEHKHININQKEERTFLFDSSFSSSGNNKHEQQAATEYHLTVTHHEENDEDNVFCDASSKSLSGYMDIKGSNYDKDGENKHLFFWMFEKRGESDETTPFMVRAVQCMIDTFITSWCLFVF